MKILKLLLSGFLIISVLGCSNDSPDPEKPVYLVKATKINDYTKEQLSTLISLAALSNPELAPFVKKIKYGVKIYYIEYKTDYTQGSTITASGLLTVPQTGNVATMLLSFQNGTIVQHSDAPSQRPNDLDFMVLHASAGMGFTICISDNIGFGSSSDKTHPYLNKSLFQKSIVNLIYAVKELEQKGTTNLNLNGDLYLTGYSLGGWASLVAHKYIEDVGIEGFNLLGSTCGAGAYNLIEMRDYLFSQTNYIQPYYLPFLLWGYSSTGDIENNMALFFNQPYATRIPSLYNGTLSGSEINSQLTSDITNLIVPDLVNNHGLSKFNKLNIALISNGQEAWKNNKPIHFFHGTADVHVPYSITENIVLKFNNLGQSTDLVKFTTLPGTNHRTGSIPMFLDVLNSFLINTN